MPTSLPDAHGAAAAGGSASGSSASPCAQALSSKGGAPLQASVAMPAAQAAAVGAGTVQSEQPGEQLPAGWSTATDAATGRTYYMHLEKVLTQWERPTE